MYTIYHIPGVKVGCSRRVEARVKEQGYANYEVLEVLETRREASLRELYWQGKLGYERDNILTYEQTLKMQSPQARLKRTKTCQNSEAWKKAQDIKINKFHTPEGKAKALKARVESEAWIKTKESRVNNLRNAETRAKAKAAKIEKYGSLHAGLVTPETVAKRKVAVVQYDMEGVFIKEWPSSKDAGIALGLHSPLITTCAKGRQKSSGGFIWKYKTNL